MTFGLILLNPATDTFALRGTTYAAMSALAPEEYWGFAFVVAGLLWLLGLVFSKPALANIGAAMTIFARLTLLFLVGISSNWSSPGLADFAWWAVLACVGDWRRRNGILL